MFNATNSDAIISKSKNIFSVFFCISGIYIKFEILWKIRWASEVISFWNCRQQKAGLVTCQKEPRVRTLTGSQNVNSSETLHKSGQQYFFLIFWSVWKKTSSKKSVLVVYEISSLCVNILTGNEKRSLAVKVTV